jgi:hypothetical protein
LNNPPVFRIRGINSINLSSFPLIVIDGIPTYSGDVSGTNAANNAAANAWSDRNSFKTALCATKSPPVTWLGSTSRSSDNPSAWDSSEILPGASWSGSGTTIASNVNVTGLNCTGSASARDNSSDSATARAAEKAKYCPGGSAPDAALCALYIGQSPTRSSIQGAKDIVDALIQKGIVR